MIRYRATLLPALLGATLLSLSAAGSASASTDVWTQWGASPQETTIRSLDLTGTGTLVASSESDGIFQSTNPVGPWSQTNQGLTEPGSLSAYQVVASGGKLYAATSAGLFTAPQGGGSWTQLGGGTGENKLNMGGIQSVVIESASALVVAVSGAAGPGVYTSSDAGDTWNRASGMPTGENIFQLAQGVGSIIYAAGESGVWTSVDAGKSWTLTSDGINPAETTFRVALGSIPNELWAAADEDVYRSVDGGLTWVNADGFGDSALPGAQLKSAFLPVPGLAASDVLVGTNDGVWASPDNGASWGQMSPDSLTAAGEFGNRIVTALGATPAPPSLLAGTRGFGVYTLPVSPVSSSATPTVQPHSGLVPGDVIEAGSSWAGTLPVFVTYTWKRCQGSSCTTVSSGPSYTIPDGDHNSAYTYEVVACAINLLVPVPVCATSAKTTGGIGSQPGQEPVPYQGINDSSLTPDPNQSYPWGTQFTVNPGDWGTEANPGTKITPVSYQYQWQRCDASNTCTVIPGATGGSYTTTAQDVGDTISGYVGVEGFFGSPSSQLYLAGSTFTIIEKTPVNTALPKIVGAPYVGSTLQSRAGAWSAHDPSYSRRWMLCAADGLDCQPLSPSATGTALKVPASALGGRLQLEVTATQFDPSQDRVGVADSALTAVIRYPPSPPKPKVPKIRLKAPHKPTVGARISGPKSEPGWTKLRYQWLRNGKPIKHATSRTYRLTKRDLGQRISLRVTLIHPGIPSVTVRSNVLKVPKPKRKPPRRRR